MYSSAFYHGAEYFIPCAVDYTGRFHASVRADIAARADAVPEVAR